MPPFKPKDGVKIAVTEKEAAEEKEKAGGGGGAAAATSDPDLMDVDTQCAGIIAQLPPPQRMAGVVQIKPGAWCTQNNPTRINLNPTAHAQEWDRACQLVPFY